MKGGVEIIALNLRDAQIIEACGGQRIELISAPEQGGLTPSYGLIKTVLKQVKIPVQVMIRPHARSFVYSLDELSVMQEDIQVAEGLGAAGVVMGMLTQSGAVDCKALEMLLGVVKTSSVTFHRAIDVANDPVQAVKVLRCYPQIKRILTSGGAGPIHQNIDILKAMKRETKDGISLLLGGGVTRKNVKMLMQTLRSGEVHLGTDVRKNAAYEEDVDDVALKLVIGIAASLAM